MSDLLQLLSSVAPDLRSRPDDARWSAIFETVSGLLKDVPVVQSLAGKRLVSIHSTGEFRIADIAAAVIKRVEDGAQPALVVSDVLDFLSNKPVKLSVVSGLAGVSVGRRVQFAPSVQLLRADELPPTVRFGNGYSILTGMVIL